jgi:L-threonylcarbamoyladenylate synthase
LISTSANRSGAQAPARFAEISAEIREAVDWVAPQAYEKGATGKPSSLMKLGLGGEIQIIRP